MIHVFFHVFSFTGYLLDIQCNNSALDLTLLVLTSYNVDHKHVNISKILLATKEILSASFLPMNRDYC